MTSILVADDVASSRVLMVTLLRQSGYQVFEARNGEEALALVRAERPALLITDVQMPVMDGCALVRAMRGDPDPAIAAIPVVYYTADADSEFGWPLVCDDMPTNVFAKPIDPPAVLRIVAAILDGPGDGGGPANPGFGDGGSSGLRGTSPAPPSETRDAPPPGVDAEGHPLLELNRLPRAARAVARSRAGGGGRAITVIDMPARPDAEPSAGRLRRLEAARREDARRRAVLLTLIPQIAAVSSDELAARLIAEHAAALSNARTVRIALVGGLAGSVRDGVWLPHAGEPAATDGPADGLALPLETSDGATLGLLSLDRRDDGAGFDDADRAWAAELAAQASVALELRRSRAQMRRALAEKTKADRRYRDLFENSPDAMYICDLNGTVLDFNRTAERMLGYDRAEVLGKSIAQFVDPAQHQQMKEMLEKKLDGEEETQYEIDLLARGGRRVRLEIRSRLIFDEGVAIGFRGSGRDITARIQDEQALRMQAQMLDAIGEAVMAGDVDGTIRYWNRAAESLFGWSAAEALGRNVFDLAIALGAHDAIREMLAQREYDTTWTYESEGIHRDGHTFPVLVSSSPLFGPDGTVRQSIAVVRDDTERKLAAQVVAERARIADLNGAVGIALTQSQTLAAMLQGCAGALVQHLDAAFARIWTLNAEENVLELKASAGLYTHLDGGHARIPVGMYKIGRIAAARWPHLSNDVGDDPEVSDREWAKREGMAAFAGYPLQVGGRLLGVVAMFARQPLSDATLQALASIADGIALGIDHLAATAAIARSLELEQALNRERQELLARVVTAQEEERRRIAADIHDDSLQVLAAVGMRLHTVGRQLADPDQQEQVVRLEAAIGAAIARLRQMLFQLRPRALDREGLVAAIRLSLEQVREDTAIDYRIDDRLTAQPPEAVRLILYRIVQEALANVRKHSAATRVTVHLREQDAGALVEVSDNGTGFDPTTDVHKQGHLGLVSMRERAEMAGGWFRIESARGRGTTVSVWVPRAAPREGNAED